MTKRILVTGHTSFAAQGIIARLLQSGAIVDCFSRRQTGSETGFRVVTGDPRRIDSAEGLADHYDVIINYLILKDGTIAQNEEYLRSLVALCRSRTVGHLIHISSISVYPAGKRDIDHTTSMETEPSTKGSYGSLKVAADLFLMKNLHHSTKLTFVRPGFILAEGLADPIVGMAFRTPWNRLLLLGESKNQVPLTSRDCVHDVVSALAQRDEASVTDRQAWLVVDPESPTRIEYLQELCSSAGFGESVLRFPAWLWRLAGISGGVAAFAARMKIRPFKIINAACRKQRYDARETTRRLGVELSCNWRELLQESLCSQRRNFEFSPPIPTNAAPVKSVAFLGFGRIVRQKHLPAIRRMAQGIRISAYDLVPSNTPGQPEVSDITQGIAPADLFVVATPGPVHVNAISQIPDSKGTVLVEKPLAYSPEELEQWDSFANSRPGAVAVCHNYRFKNNVVEMMDFLRRYNPGQLKHVRVQFHSPPVSNESAVWLRNERKARTLLMDYGLHFIDLACRFSNDRWDCTGVRFETNGRGETSLIQGTAVSKAYTVDFLLRQGAIPRKATIQYIFQNYDVRLSFFPDTVSFDMSGETGAVLRKCARRMDSSVRRKVFDKILGRDSDDSHAKAILAAASGSAELSVGALKSVYALLFEISKRVYGPVERE